MIVALDMQENLTGHVVEILRSETSLVKVGEKGKVVGFAKISFIKTPGYCVEVWGHLLGGHQRMQLFFTRNELRDLGIRETIQPLKEVA
jgi:hypothetical protein